MAWWRILAPYSGPTNKINRIFEITDGGVNGGGRHLENHKIAMSPQRFDGSLRKLVQRCKMGVLTAPTVKNLNFINPRWRTPSFWKPINYNISANVFYHCWWNFAPWWTIPISETVVSLYNLKKIVDLKPALAEACCSKCTCSSLQPRRVVFWYRVWLLLARLRMLSFL